MLRSKEVVHDYIMRAAKKHTIWGLSRETGISRGTLQNYVHQRTKPSAENFLTIVFSLNQSMDEMANMSFEIAQAMGEQE